MSPCRLSAIKNKKTELRLGIPFWVEGGARTHDIQNHNRSVIPLFMGVLLYLAKTLLKHI